MNFNSRDTSTKLISLLTSTRSYEAGFICMNSLCHRDDNTTLSPEGTERCGNDGYKHDVSKLLPEKARSEYACRKSTRKRRVLCFKLWMIAFPFLAYHLQPHGTFRTPFHITSDTKGRQLSLLSKWWRWNQRTQSSDQFLISVTDHITVEFTRRAPSFHRMNSALRIVPRAAYKPMSS